MNRRIVNHRPKNIKVQIKNEVVDAIVEREIEIMREEIERVEEEILDVIDEIEEKIIEPVVEEVIEEKEEIKEEVDERVICVNTNVIYEDCEDASEKVGVSKSAIKRCVNGKSKSAGRDAEGNKLIWKYVRDL